MDCLETIVKERNQVRENIISYSDNLKQYQGYLNQLKDALNETQLCKSQTAENLEINDVTKNIFDEDYKEIKMLIGKIYNYLQQVEETIATVTENENAIKELFDENAERLKKIETNVLNEIQVSEITQKNVNDRITTARNKIQEEMNQISEVINECEQTVRNTLDEYEKQETILKDIKIEIEILEDDIDLEIQQHDALLRETQYEGQKILEEMKNNIELNNKILEEEETILQMSELLREILADKEELIQKQIEGQKTSQQLDKEYEDLQNLINTTKNENAKRLDDCNKVIEEKKNLLLETQLKLETSQNKTSELNKAIEQQALKIAMLDAELASLKEKLIEDNDYLEKNNLVDVSKEAEDLKENFENLQKMLRESKDELNKYEEELEKLKSTSNSELKEYQEKLNALEAEKINISTLEKELEEIDLENKNRQQTVEQHQIAIKDYTSQKIQVQLELEANQKQLKNITMQCESVEKEILRLEISKKENIRLVPNPSLKRPRSKIPSRPAKKPSLFGDGESDSSVDGERLSYAEFMAKKRMLHVKKHTK